ncbi:hypothetical protein HYD70_02790 [Mycoplasmopsis bovis]|nr:hypothetical protein HYD70_02790 [Mycoplasmopsis bovis]
MTIIVWFLVQQGLELSETNKNLKYEHIQYKVILMFIQKAVEKLYARLYMEQANYFMQLKKWLLDDKMMYSVSTSYIKQYSKKLYKYP